MMTHLYVSFCGYMPTKHTTRRFWFISARQCHSWNLMQYVSTVSHQQRLKCGVKLQTMAAVRAKYCRVGQELPWGPSIAVQAKNCRGGQGLPCGRISPCRPSIVAERVIERESGLKFRHVQIPSNPPKSRPDPLRSPDPL